MITYVDTSVLLKLLVDDEGGIGAAERLWVESDVLVTVELTYVEARAALAAARRDHRVDDEGLRRAERELELLWAQVDVVAMSAELVRSAGELAEEEALRGYDAVHLAAAEAAGAAVFAAADARLLAGAARRELAIADPLGNDPGPGAAGR